ncbi:hypothetical protein B0H10DRAFT_2344712 [Mycena sp. CBHHK59/15]|nr:hypothetical protein B0H10DRAFT_2344712 [Mycena sp. CBHHK59/15]
MALQKQRLACASAPEVGWKISEKFQENYKNYSPNWRSLVRLIPGTTRYIAPNAQHIGLKPGTFAENVLCLCKCSAHRWDTNVPAFELCRACLAMAPKFIVLEVQVSQMRRTTWAGIATRDQSQESVIGNVYRVPQICSVNALWMNTDPDDVSLAAGNGYFPPDDKYKEYLAKIPVSREKSTCNYLKVVNKQDKKKFKNMAITGAVNCQCSHVFILSCVDLQYGERFSNTDAALAREMRQRKPGESFDFILRIEVEDIDQVTTYDIACEDYINLESRFQQHFPDLVETAIRQD